MIEIKSERTEAGVELALSFHGPGGDIVSEAAVIMKQLPKQIKGMSETLFEHFVEELREFGYEVKEMERYDEQKPKRMEGLS